MLALRFQKTGKKHQPTFKIAVIEKRKSSTHGRFVEEVGFYNPRTKEKILRQDRIKYWLSVGVQPSATVHNLLVSEKIIEDKKIDVHKKAKKPAESQDIQAGKEEKSAPAPEPAPAPEAAPAAPVSAPESAPAKEEKPLGHSPEAGPTGEAAEEQPKETPKTE